MRFFQWQKPIVLDKMENNFGKPENYCLMTLKDFSSLLSDKTCKV